MLARNVTRRLLISLEKTPKHVLHAIGGIEDTSEHTLRRFAERVEEHALAVHMDRIALVEERVVVENVLGESPRVLGEAEASRRDQTSSLDRWST